MALVGLVERNGTRERGKELRGFSLLLRGRTCCRVLRETEEEDRHNGHRHLRRMILRRQQRLQAAEGNIDGQYGPLEETWRMDG